MKTTINDVAHEAGVSGTAVSLALQGNARVGEETQKRIFAAIRKLNYVPNSTAQNLRSGKTNTVGFIVNDITNPFYSLMLKEAEHKLNSMGLEMFIASSNWNINREVKLIEKMIQMRVQGIIICFCEKGTKTIELLDSFSVPYVAVDSYPEFYKGNFIANDFEICGRMVAEHFYEIGCRNPGIINADKSMMEFSAFKRIFTAFKQFFSEKGIAVKNKNIVEAGLTLEAGKKALKSLKLNSYDADAFFCANDLCAMGFMEAAEYAGIVIGKDIALAGIDDLPLSSFAKISLTSVRQPYAAIAYKAAEVISGYIKEGNKINLHEELKPELIKRNSTILYSQQ
ncbi:MAG: LacI family DNA-binding transcriptional regulator [Victivallaceae bacterium]|jgi:LacI family transcriptional regulator